MLCIYWNFKSAIYHEVFKSSEIIISDRYYCQLLCINKELKRKGSFTGEDRRIAT